MTTAACLRMPPFFGRQPRRLEFHLASTDPASARSSASNGLLLWMTYAAHRGSNRWSLAPVLLVAALALLVGRSRSEPSATNSGRSPARLTEHSSKTRHFEYVIADGAIYVYSIDHANRLVQTIRLPQIGTSIHGVVASPRTGRLYIAYGQQKPPGGALLAYDLRHGRTLWYRTYSFGIDSMAISPNGRWIYMPAGERTSDGKWRIIAASSGKPSGRSIAGPDRRPQHDHGPGRSLSVPGRRRLPVPRGGKHRNEPCRAQDRPPQWARGQAVHHQRLPDARLHDRKKLPRFPSQQHQHAARCSTPFRFRASPSTRRSSRARPTMASRSRPTNAGSI